ncbi:ParB/RepB/Spo0J family partition protein [Peredibacter sp. HCB2-198]|uniref:ParB/RepB/Spo0J family partition protein n=1 Tax=Peredibacter sp. HCB2-198 TaxID=3383025 RepID=UPI0038B51A9D
MEIRKLNELKATNPYLRLGTDVSELEKSIQTLGLIAPLVISPDNVILAGARRYQAMLNLGFTETPVMVVDRNELERELVSIDENLVRKDLTKIEVESHLRRAKEIYQALNPHEEVEAPVVEAAPVETTEDAPKAKKVQVLPAEKFLNMVSEKTGLSPKQIHEAINRDEMAASVVKEARKNGELSLSQTNEIVKLNKEEQEEAIEHVKELPVREIKKFVKIAKAQGIEKAIAATPNDPNQREFQEIDQALKKIIKKFKQLQIEGIEVSDFPEETQDLYNELVGFANESYSPVGRDSMEMDSIHQ